MKQQHKTPIFASFRRAFQLALSAERQQTQAAEVIGQAQAAAASRRRFLENTGKTLLVGALAPPLLSARPLRPFWGSAPPNIVIVGGGIAGLNALHHLKKHHLDATIYEASARCGGRMMTVQQAMGEGTWMEFGGEFIDTNHADMWALAKEFDLELMDFAQASEAALEAEAYFFDGRFYSLEALVEEFRRFAPRMKADMARLAAADTSYTATDPFVKKLDCMSISKYLKKIGAGGWVKKFIETAYESEYGLSPKVQSSLNLTLLLSPDTSEGQLSLFGESDERYKIRGGNQRITDALAKKYAANILTHSALESIRSENNGTYRLHFSGRSEDVLANYVILTLPFTRLRSVEMKLEMPPVKKKCIEQFRLGANAKLMLGMKSHFWRTQGYTGLVYSDTGIPNAWDNAQLQTKDHQAAGLTVLFGGKSGVKVGEGLPDFQKNIFLDRWEQIFKGAREQFNGKVARMHWLSHPFTLGSYTCYTRGQYTSIAGAEQLPIGNVLFAGEHCGGEFAGFMNGAAKSGREAAEEVLKRLG